MRVRVGEWDEVQRQKSSLLTLPLGQLQGSDGMRVGPGWEEEARSDPHSTKLHITYKIQG
jgi:hypothetical protein